MKTFTRAGVSTNKGKTSFRFTNDMNRETVLFKNNHTDIKFFELGEPMSKEDATAFLVAKGLEESRGPRKTTTPATKAKAAPIDDDGFVEPKDEATQVAMCRKAREYPGLSPRQIYETVMLELDF